MGLGTLGSQLGQRGFAIGGSSGSDTIGFGSRLADAALCVVFGSSEPPGRCRFSGALSLGQPHRGRLPCFLLGLICDPLRFDFGFFYALGGEAFGLGRRGSNAFICFTLGIGDLGSSSLAFAGDFT